MKTQIAVLLAGTLAIWAWNHPWQVRLKTLVPAAWFGLGAFVLAQAILSGLMHAGAMERFTDFGQVRAHVLRHLDARPLLLFVGSSYTARNLDGAVVEATLRTQGVAMNVQQLSMPGRFAFHQDYELERFLDQTPEKPFVVVMELGTEFSPSPRPEDRFRNEAFTHHDLRRAREILAMQSASPDTSWEDLSVTIRQTLGHHAHVGIAHAARPERQFPPKPGYQPEPWSGFDPEHPPAAGPAGRSASAVPAFGPAQLAQSTAFREQQAARLAMRGIPRVVFLAPVTLDRKRRDAYRTLCSQLAECLLPPSEPDPASLTWNDLSHLSDAGAREYSRGVGNLLATQLRTAHVLR